MTRLLGPAVLANIASPLPPFLIGALGLDVRRDLGLSTAALGVAVTAFFITTALLSPWMGRLVDRGGWVRPLSLAAAGTALAILGLALTAGVAWLVAMLALAGVANAAVVPATNAALAASIPAERFGLAVGISQAAVPLAGVVAGLCVPLAAGHLPWRIVISLCAAIPAIAAPLIATIRPTRPSTVVAGESTVEELPPARRALGWATFTAGLATILVGTLGTLYVLLVVAGGIGAETAGVLLAVGGLTGAAVRVATGLLLTDLAGQGLRVMGALLFCGIVGAALLALHPGSIALIAIATVLVFAGGWGWPAAFYGALLRRHAGDPARATGKALTGMAVGAIVGPAAFGVLAEHRSASIAWLGLAVVAGAAALAGWRSDGLYRA